MLQVRNGKLEMKHVAFALPEGFCLKPNPILNSVTFTFVSEKVKGVYLVIALEKSNATEKQTLEDFCADGEFVKRGGFLRIKRGSKEGVGLFYGCEGGDEEYYEEVYNFKEEDGKNQFSVFIECTSEERGTHLLQEILDSPNVKKFFDSIEYR